MRNWSCLKFFFLGGIVMARPWTSLFHFPHYFIRLLLSLSSAGKRCSVVECVTLGTFVFFRCRVAKHYPGTSTLLLAYYGFQKMLPLPGKHVFLPAQLGQ